MLQVGALLERDLLDVPRRSTSGFVPCWTTSDFVAGWTKVVLSRTSEVVLSRRVSGFVWDRPTSDFVRDRPTSVLGGGWRAPVLARCRGVSLAPGGGPLGQSQRLRTEPKTGLELLE